MIFAILFFVLLVFWAGSGALTLNQWIQEALDIEEQMEFFIQMESEQSTVGNAARYFTKRMELYNKNEELLSLLKEKREQPNHFWFSTVPSFMMLGPILLVPFLRNRIH